MSLPHPDPPLEPIQKLLVHADFLRALARQLVADDSEADDVVQDVWLRSLHHPPPRGDSSKGWLARVTRNLVSDRRRNSAARRRREDRVIRNAHHPLRAGGESELAERLELLDELGRALAALPQSYREALYLRYYEDVSPEAIAARLDRPTATVKTQLRRGLELLRTDMEGRTAGRGRLGALLAPLALGVGVSRAEAATTLWTGILIMKKAILVTVVALVAVGSYQLIDSAPPLDAADRELAVEVELEAALDAPDVAADLGRLEPQHVFASADSRATVDAAVERAKLFGTVRYSNTGHGVPFYRFLAVDGARQEWITTDEVGRYRSNSAFPALFTAHLEHTPTPPELGANPAGSVQRREGVSVEAVRITSNGGPGDSLEVITSDWIVKNVVMNASTEERAVERATLSGACDLSVNLGPTFLLDFSCPPDCVAEDFEAEYAPLDDQFTSHAKRRAEPSAEPRLWVRFPYESPSASDSPTWQLRLRSANGIWSGSADVPFVLGVHDVPVHIDLVEHGTLEGRVVDQNGAPLPDMYVHMQSNALDAKALARTDADGNYRFDLLAAGRYALFVKDTDHYPYEAAQLIRAGERHVADIALDARPPGGSLKGRLTSTTGTFQGRVVIFLEGLDDQDVWRRADPVWVEENGRFVGEYCFAELGSGSYSVSCCTVDAVPVEGRLRVVSPPNESVDFHVDDGRPLRELRLRPIDEATGEALESYRVYFHAEGNVEILEPGTSSAPWMREVSEGVDFRWRVHAPGYRAASGNQSDFTSDHQLEVALTHGFSAVVNLNSIESMRSLAGVEVFADGISVAWTDADGFAYLEFDRRPTEITVDPTLWTIYSDDTFRSDLAGALADWNEQEVFLSAYLRPVR